MEFFQHFQGLSRSYGSGDYIFLDTAQYRRHKFKKIQSRDKRLINSGIWVHFRNSGGRGGLAWGFSRGVKEASQRKFGKDRFRFAGLKMGNVLRALFAHKLEPNRPVPLFVAGVAGALGHFFILHIFVLPQKM
jgi:hypothetical protein